MATQLEQGMNKIWLENLELRRLLSADIADETILPVEEEPAAIIEEAVVDTGSEDTPIDDSDLIFYTMIDFGNEESVESVDPDLDSEVVETEVIDPAICYFAVDPIDTRGVDENGEIQPNFRGQIDETIDEIEDPVIDLTIDEPIEEPIEAVIDPLPEGWIGICGFGLGEEIVNICTIGPETEELPTIDSAPVDETVETTSTEEKMIYTILPVFEPQASETPVSTEVAHSAPSPEPESVEINSIFSDLEIASTDEVLT